METIAIDEADVRIDEADFRKVVERLFRESLIEDSSDNQEPPVAFSSVELDSGYLREYCHQHRTFLTPISGWSALLLSKHKPKLSVVQTIRSNAQKLTKLIRELEFRAESLNENNADLKEYLRQYCHRHRTLLTPILGWSALLLSKHKPHISVVTVIRRNAEELEQLIKELEAKI